MSKIAYFDCFSGCSGDMILGALLDVGLSEPALKAGLNSIPLEGYHLVVEKTKRASIAATRVKVIIDEDEVLPERSLSDILEIIEASDLSTEVKERGVTIFQRLGQVESKIHGSPLDEVHFHELGGIDSIVDIMGVVIGFSILGIEQFYSSPLPLGGGKVSTAHGILPVPAPATLELIAMVQAPVTDFTNPLISEAELVTPTGAAIITSLANFRRPSIILENVGYGAGEKDFGAWPNVLRLWVGEETVLANNEELILLETNIDDMNPEIYGYLMDKLFKEGAVDVWYTPIQMKKNRPATMVSVLAPRYAEFNLTETMMRETSTLGIRVRPICRHTAERDILEFESSLGRVEVKVKRFSGEILSMSPEYEDCRRIALERGTPLREVYRVVEMESWKCFAGSVGTKVENEVVNR